MKKILTFIFIMLLVLALTTVAMASELETPNDKGEELKAYIEEKIVPIIMGVATSIIALLGTLKGVFNALRGLKESKDTFDREQAKITENSKRELEEIKAKYNEIKLLVVDVPKLSTQIEELKAKSSTLATEISNLSKIASLGFSENSQLVKDGKSREIVRLANKNEELISGEGI